MIKLNKIVLTLITAMACISEIIAVTANPSPVTVTNPDGTQLTLNMKGDERRHYRMSIDDYTVMEDHDGYYKYAIDSAGTLKPGKIRAHNPDKRSLSERLFLQSHPTRIMQKDTASAFGSHHKMSIESFSKRHSDSQSSLRAAATPSRKYMVLLIDFADVKFSRTNSDFTNLLNQSGYTASGATGYAGSVKDYYTDNSSGQFIPQFDVYGPITLSQNMAYYGGNDADDNDLRPREMILEACALANNLYPTLNFSTYDNDGNKVVDNVAAFYAGYAESNGAPANTIWPHQWSVSGLTANKVFDNTSVDSYSCSSELKGVIGTEMEGIGTFCHEFGHVLGLPDLYDTDDDENGLFFDSNAYNLMSSGNYNNNSNTPPYLSIFERELLGWATSTKLSGDITISNLAHIGASNKAYYIHTNPQPAAGAYDTEWFYLENRQKTGWDSYIPGHGLIISHVDMSANAISTYWNTGLLNAYSSHPCYDLLEADGLADYGTRGGDPFPGTSGKSSFTDTGTPNALSWGSVATQTPVTQITESSSLISFVVGNGTSTATQIINDEDTTPSVSYQQGQIIVSNLSDDASVSLFDVSGRLISSRISSSNKAVFQITTSGVFLIRVNQNNMTKTLKIAVTL